MKIVEPGHIYDLDWLDGKPRHIGEIKELDGAIPAILRTEWRENQLIFVNREEGSRHPGTQTQEVLRALIDRTRHCDQCLRWPGNDQIIQHLRMALVLHEARALERKTEKGLLLVESIATDTDGHFELRSKFR